MSTVLNPVLYRRLKRIFGRVKIASQGEAMIARPTKGVEGEPRLWVIHNGEYYSVCCPYCNDTRFRLNVHHMFGKKDAHGRKMRYLTYCYNENCLARPANWEDLVDRIEDSGTLEDVEIRQGVEVPMAAREVQLPGPCKLLSELKPTNRGVSYLAGRGFDTDMLARRYGVLWCLDSQFSLARNRIIIPVSEKGKLVGWQARYPEDLDWKNPDKDRRPPFPKYWSCPGADFRAKCIYNLDSMRKWETGVVVEGPTDVWRFGAMSGCIFGNTVTAYQRKKLLTVFRKRTLVMLLDPEEFESDSTARTVEEFTRAMPGRFAAVKLPDETDPGSLDRVFARAYVKEEAARQGVKVTYKMVAA
jgi:uncharacterized Zn-finger protein